MRRMKVMSLYDRRRRREIMKEWIDNSQIQMRNIRKGLVKERMFMRNNVT
jgi:hypothetical protein